MNFLRAIILIAGLSLNLWAQTPEQQLQKQAEQLQKQAEELARAFPDPEERNWDTRIFPIKYIDPNQLAAALNVFRARLQPRQDLHVLSVRAPKEIMPAIEDAIKRLDVPMPSKNAELTIYILAATDQAEPNGAAIPQALQPVVSQLRNVLSYKAYQLVDTLIARANDRRSAPTSLMGTLPSGGTYNFRARFRIDNVEGKTPILRLDDMQFMLEIRASDTNIPTHLSISTDVEIPRGQQVVVGKATYGNRAYILVMSAQFPQ